MQNTLRYISTVRFPISNWNLNSILGEYPEGEIEIPSSTLPTGASVFVRDGMTVTANDIVFRESSEEVEYSGFVFGLWDMTCTALCFRGNFP